MLFPRLESNQTRHVKSVMQYNLFATEENKKAHLFLVRPLGFEPKTFPLKAGYSTN